MKQCRVFMLLAILLPIVSLSDDTEILLRKYSGKIDNNEVNFFLQIEKNTHKIQGGVVTLPKDEEMRRVSTNEANGNITPASPWWDAIELTPELELQIIHNRKITTLAPQCPAQNLCSYIYEGGLMYFPSLQMAVLPSYDHLETFVAKNYEEAKKIFKYEDKNQGARHSFETTLLFVSDNYMSFENSYFNDSSGFGGTWTDRASTGALLDIKTKKIFSFENIFKKGKDTLSRPMIPYTLYCKYSDSTINGSPIDNCSSCKKEGNTCPKEIDVAKHDVYTGGIYGYFDGFYYGYHSYGSRPGINVPVNGNDDDPNAEWEYIPGNDFDEDFRIPLKELKPHLKPGWYDYLIGKGELPKF
ncbi:hypothetical protein [Helicobacter cinaedi]|uniref:Uncharacterized protein n=1 Tax=Helicobacter cinaedi TaxID=213 RepID=A0A377JME3_9HELI|nr:hypothetical protein [Helicobacter cinaedi]STP08971.1 Uncharacterised protein [Helicobacter cinaedi]